MQFTELTIEEFDQFTRTHFSHFTQTKENYLLKQSQGVETYLVGVKDGESIKAACLVTLTPMMKVFKYAYSNRGPVMDYADKQVFDVFFEGLHAFLKPKKVMHVRIDPYEVIKERDHDGEVLNDRDNGYIFDHFKDQGFKHDGFTTGFDPVLQIRWHSVLELEGKDPKTLLDDMDSLRKRNIKKAQKHGLHIRYLELDEIDVFRKFMRDTSEKKAFVDRDDAYYISRKEHFGDNVIIPLVYVNLDEYTASIAKDRDALVKNIEKTNKDLEKDPDNQKAAKKIGNFKDQLKNIEDKLAEGEALRETHGEELPIASAYYFITPHEVVYLAGGSDNDFRHFAGSYLIQWHMINYALEKGIDLYNFYGISGNFSEEAEDYGVIQFKRGFNAKVFEYAGDFTKPVNGPAYNAYKTLTKLRDKIGR